MNNKNMNGAEPTPPEEKKGKVPCSVLQVLLEHNACAAIAAILEHPGFGCEATEKPVCRERVGTRPGQ